MKTALLLIDIQNDYFEGGKSELENPLIALENAKKVLERFRTRNQTIIHVQHINTREGASFFITETEGAKIHKDVEPKENEFVIIKNVPNSFHNTNLLDILRSNEIDSIVICGMMSHMCIDTTTRATKDYDFNVILLSDACATKNLMFCDSVIPAKTVHETFMASLNGIFAKVVTTENFIADNTNL